MEITAKIKSYLSVCSDAPTFMVDGKSFEAGSQQEFTDVQLVSCQVNFVCL